MILTYSIILLLNLILFFLHNKLHKINYPVDRPNKRKIHSENVLLSGGLFLLTNLIIILIIKLFSNTQLITFSVYGGENFFLISTIFFFLLGLVDDKINLNPNLKLLIIIIILSIFLIYNENFIIDVLKFSFIDQTIYLGKYSFIFTILCLSLFINAFNMYDGINLQSGSYSIMFFIFFIFKYYNFHFSSFFIFSLILFLIKNFKTKSFLGDNGCYILSFVIGIFIIDLYKLEKIYADQIFLLMMLPGIDMLRLFVLRIISKKNPFVGDKNHLHHILLNLKNQNKVFIILFSVKFLIFISVFFNINSIIIFSMVILIYALLLKKKSTIFR